MSATLRPLRAGAHIVATEIRCAVGLTASSAAAAIRAGISRIIEHPFFEDEDGGRIFGACDPSLDYTTVGVERISQLAQLGLRQISEKLAAMDALPLDIDVLLALPEVRPGFGADAAARVTHWLTSQPLPTKRSVRIAHVGEGHAGALAALKVAADLVSSGEHDIVIVGGVDSYFDADTIKWLDTRRLLARPGQRSGFPPGEAAAFIAVASERACERRGIDSLGRLHRIACTQETRDPGGDVGPLGEALGDAILQAVRGLNPPSELITDAYGDINGEVARNHDWGFAVLRSAPYFRDASDYITAASECGDVGAATGALGCVLATEAWKFKKAQGPRALVWAGSWKGLRAAAVIEAA